mmetsp:Transcript_66203/g.191063  ORF Transcript_66203/g.191063 Transcript_66203/m.191063 type:complete len:350 (-) Transcript_66203:260-1309(-)
MDRHDGARAQRRPHFRQILCFQGFNLPGGELDVPPAGARIQVPASAGLAVELRRPLQTVDGHRCPGPQARAVVRLLLADLRRASVAQQVVQRDGRGRCRREVPVHRGLRPLPRGAAAAAAPAVHLHGRCILRSAPPSLVALLQPLKPLRLREIHVRIVLLLLHSPLPPLLLGVLALAVRIALLRVGNREHLWDLVHAPGEAAELALEDGHSLGYDLLLASLALCDAGARVLDRRADGGAHELGVYERVGVGQGEAHGLGQQLTCRRVEPHIAALLNVRNVRGHRRVGPDAMSLHQPQELRLGHGLRRLRGLLLHLHRRNGARRAIGYPREVHVAVLLHRVAEDVGPARR